MSDLANGIIGGLIAGVVIGAIGFGLVVKWGWQDSAITHNCAQYNPTTGDFQWNETPPQQ